MIFPYAEMMQSDSAKKLFFLLPRRCKNIFFFLRLLSFCMHYPAHIIFVPCQSRGRGTGRPDRRGGISPTTDISPKEEETAPDSPKLIAKYL